MPCQLNEDIIVDDGDGEAASEDPRTPKRDVPAEERLESPAKTRKQSFDAELTNSNLLQHMKGMLESNK